MRTAGGITLKVAIVHYWLVSMRGGEKVLEALCELFPTAEIFTHVYDPHAVSSVIRRQEIKTTLISRLPFATRLYKNYLPLMPMALEQLDLREYDLVISSESGPAKGVLTRPDALHVCYCHSPMRYIWNMYIEYKKSANPFMRPIITWLAGSLRIWDQNSSNRVDLFIANSENIKRQIRKYYRRDSVVVYPPVDVDAFVPTVQDGGYYLAVGQLVRYKRMDLAIEACSRLGRRLIVVGEGEEYDTLHRIAGPTVSLVGKQDAADLQEYYRGCRALIFPGEEDFGIVPVEAMASGKPVIALRRGGAIETVVHGHTGLFFEEQSAEALERSIRHFEEIEASFDASAIAQHARRFSRDEFKRRFLLALEHHQAIEASLPASIVESTPPLGSASLAEPRVIAGDERAL
jgi:glycosyltransferase involved in cell wall biosynthesis